MKILVTGSTGFVGRNVKEYLELKGYDIYAPNSRDLDCLDEEQVEKFLTEGSYDMVVHLAVYGDAIDKTRNGMKILEYNLRMFHNFAKCSKLYKRMIYTGSGAEFDKRYPILRISEDEIGRSIPVDQYGLMKYTLNQIIEQSNNIYNLRLFGIFGKYEQWETKFISNICCKAIKDLPLTIRQNCKFDYLWIHDFCKILEGFIHLENPRYHSYNITSGSRIELKELTDMVVDISGKKLPVIICKEGMANEYTANNERILSELMDFRHTDIYEAIKELYSWYMLQEDKINLYSLIYG